MKISNVNIYGLGESIVASGYPKRLEQPSEEVFRHEVNKVESVVEDIKMYKFVNAEEEIANSHVKRAIKLANTPMGSGHYNYLKGISVHYDLTAPEYFWRQFDRYHFHDYTSSQSKMISILKFDIYKKCNKYVSQNTIDELQYWIRLYNHYKKNKVPHISLRNGKKIEYNKQNIFQIIMSNCPMGFQLTARITDNYSQLKSKYHQRANHKLEEWRKYCNWIETLPMAYELIMSDN